MKKLAIFALSLFYASNTTLYSTQSPRYKRFQEHLMSINIDPQAEDIENLIEITEDIAELQGIYPSSMTLPLTPLEFLADRCGLHNTTRITEMYIAKYGIHQNEIDDAIIRNRETIAVLKSIWAKKPDSFTKHRISECQTFGRFLEALKI